MKTERVYCPPTTQQQRRQLFETWEKTGNVSKACQKARVSRQTFYNWKARFEKEGYEGLKEPRSHARKEPGRIGTEVEEKIIKMRRENPKWGKRRIADELAKANSWVPLASAATVKRVLKDAGLWPEPEEKKRCLEPVARTADEPGQALNIDLCFVPATHEDEEKLPAVSGSSGRLVIENVAQAGMEPDYPGRVFEDRDKEYVEAMLEFVNASREKDENRVSPSPETEQASLKAKKRALRIEKEQLRNERRQVRHQRDQEDILWKKQKLQWQKQKIKLSNISASQRKLQDETWHLIRDARRHLKAQRLLEDEQWHQHKLSLREREAQLPIITSWIAILVVTDNCTRQCIGLPLFIAGSHVTSQMIVEALQHLLPPELLFIISDRGIHFTADAFKQLVNDEEFIHVLIARHRPQSNGIAERFVRTLKEWLKDKSWLNEHDLDTLLLSFLDEYNNCPHQGLSIPGLSPNEFANRIFLF